MRKDLSINIRIPRTLIEGINNLITDKLVFYITALFLTSISIYSFIFYYNNGLGLAYNDARSHLDIGRRVVEGLKPGIAQLGSVWLPLPHVLMIPTIWNDFMWHSGLAGALVSMISFIATGLLIYKFLEHLGAGKLSRVLGVVVFTANINILYLQSTAMTELLLLATMTFATYELMMWQKEEDMFRLVKCAFWVMLSTLTRYDGWFLLAWTSLLVIILVYRKGKYLKTEGLFTLFSTLAGFGIILWLLWNFLIFKDPLFFAFGPYSAKAQQDQLELAGVLQTKHNLWLSIKFYFYALVYNSGMYTVILGILGAVAIWADKLISKGIRIATSALAAPLVFNIIALYLGHSVLFIQGLSGDTWFNVRYGIMLAPSFAIFIGYLFEKTKNYKSVILGTLLFITFFTFSSQDAVTIDDARVGSSQKNVTEVSGWLKENAANKDGFILISAASHDAIIFSSGLPMKKFIHEGTGLYWQSATSVPDRWARWIVMRTYDDNDSTYKEIKDSPGFERFNLVKSFPFADIYEIQPEYVEQLNTKPVLGKQK